jgi:hypothetical protein
MQPTHAIASATAQDQTAIVRLLMIAPLPGERTHLGPGVLVDA